VFKSGKSYGGFIRKALQNHRHIVFQIAGKSMEPTLFEGQTVIVGESSIIREGDVVLFEDRTQRLLIHRVISFRDSEVVTAGDNNRIADLPISRKQILGIVKNDSVLHRCNKETILKPVLLLPNTESNDSISNHAIRNILITKVNNPSGELKKYKEQGWTTIFIHQGARQTICEVPFEATNVLFLCGFPLKRESDPESDNGVIGVYDIDHVVRIRNQIWQETALSFTVEWLDGFCGGRLVEWRG